MRWWILRTTPATPVFCTDFAGVHVQVFKDICGDSAAFLNEPQKNVFGADEVVAEPLGLFAGQSHYLAGAISKSVKHVSFLTVSEFGFPRGNPANQVASLISLYALATKN